VEAVLGVRGRGRHTQYLRADRELRKFCPPVVHVPPASEGGEPTAVPGQARQWTGGGSGSKRNGGRKRKKKLRGQSNVAQ